ncbi:hypothetical protein NQZ79_g3505 [Umbelopsis isabellina]|nr:hypothetical protein NQZ79_g3505 [Umbelopsis isabellina]
MSLAGFQDRKNKVISELVEEMNPERADKSPKGYIDAPILPLMRLINQHSQFYTTSSCSGRIAVYCEGVDEKKLDVAKSTKGGTWLYVTHDPVTLPDTIENKDAWIMQLLFGEAYANVTTDPISDEDKITQRQLVFFKFEPLILHVEADSEEGAHDLLGLANVIGYQNSGITPSKTRHMLAIRSTHKLDVPIASVDPTTQRIHLLVDTTYLYVLLRLSNQKFTQNIDRMKKFEQAVETQLLVKDQMETKEQRRERKRREGLERQKAAGKQDHVHARARAVMDMYDDFDESGSNSTTYEDSSANRGQALMDLYEDMETI